MERTSERNLARAQQIARLGSWEHELASHRLFWSDEIFRIFGIPQEGFAATYEAFLAAVHPEDRPRMQEAHRQALAGETRLNIEHRIVRPDGTIRWVHELGELERDEQGNPTRLTGTVLDITDRKQAERRLKAFASVARRLGGAATPAEAARVIAEATDDLFGWDAFSFDLCDPETDRVTPILTVDLVEGARETVPPTYENVPPSPLVRRVLREGPQLILREEPLFIEPELLPFGDRARPSASIMIVPVRFNEKAIAVIGVHSYRSNAYRREDLHALEGVADQCGGALTQIRAREALRQSEDRLREQATLLDKAQDAILVRDLHDRILYWNRSAERVYGWKAEEVLGKSVAELLYTDPSAFTTATQHVLNTGDWVGEIDQFTNGGKKITVEGRWTLVRDSDGKPKSILSINTDVTQRKKLEAQFLRVQRMESIGTLAGGIAHDLNNVLTPIMMSIELLKTAVPEGPNRDILNTIAESARRGAELISQVLSFARGMEGRRMEVNLRSTIRDLLKIAGDTFPKNIRIEAQIEADLWPLIADPTQLYQVLLNLAINARDAMPRGGKITISAKNMRIDANYAAMNLEAKVGSYVRLEVEDTGTGIAPEIIEKIFDPFFTTKPVGEGTGLGLATAQAIVKGHGGFVHVYSEPGRGSRFRVYLPAQSQSRGKTFEAEQEQLPRGNGELILVVDDETSVRQITKQTLETFGYRVLLAADGSEAVSIFVQHQAEIALVLTDMMMPIMDGPMTIQVLLKLNPRLRIVAASGIAANGKVAQALGAGVKHFVPKPYTAETLLKIIRQALDELA